MHALIHELTLLQERDGWLSESELRALAKRLELPLHRLESVSTFYTHFRRTPPKRVEIAVCRDLSCALAGGREAAQRLRAALAGRDDVEIRETSCIGRCDRAPAGFAGHDVVSTHRTDEVVALVEGRRPQPTCRARDGWG
ncbi:MAG TPA: NAD(P)H-dependent oxidoreductase subunit E, partial [Myxococcota bacterium]|nr:NAD(P)H-dependent oxidoreductase subunit E [Myxococcota bacterium]